MIVVIEKTANGKIEFTKEELEELLEKAKQAGITEAQRYNYIYTTPSNPSPVWPTNPYISPFTYQTPQTIATSEVNGAEMSNDI